MKKYLIVGNWKMNPATSDEAREIAKKVRATAAELKQTSVVICPPFVFIPAVSKNGGSDSVSLGAQWVSYDESGAHTSEISAKMLNDLGVSYVIIGHSETRERGDTDANVAKRTLAALNYGLTPIVCVGEKAREESGSHYEFLREQIKNSLADVPKKYARDIVIAYEPVWAIGAKEAMNAEQILETSLFVKKTYADLFGQSAGMNVTVLYGGSVNASNAAEIISVGKVDGLLPGRASIIPAEFTELVKAVDGVK